MLENIRNKAVRQIAEECSSKVQSLDRVSSKNPPKQLIGIAPNIWECVFSVSKGILFGVHKDVKSVVREALVTETEIRLTAKKKMGRQFALPRKGLEK